MRKFIIIIFLLLPFKSQAVLNESVCANLVVTQIKIINTALSGAAETEAITMWTAICKGLITHIKTAMQLVLNDGDIPVDSAGLLDSIPAPVTGATTTKAVVLPVGKFQ